MFFKTFGEIPSLGQWHWQARRQQAVRAARAGPWLLRARGELVENSALLCPCCIGSWTFGVAWYCRLGLGPVALAKPGWLADARGTELEEIDVVQYRRSP